MTGEGIKGSEMNKTVTWRTMHNMRGSRSETTLVGISHKVARTQLFKRISIDQHNL